MADTAAAAPVPAGGAAPDPVALLRSPGYVRLLLIAALVGVPISAAAYYFLQLVEALPGWVFADLPRVMGFAATPLWWPLPVLGLAGVLVGLTIRNLAGRGGHSPVDGFAARGAPVPAELPGILLAALASLGLGAVLGPEAPLIALGAGLAVCAARLARRDVPAQVGAVVAAAGSFAAISALLGSPIIGAFLLMEASGLGGATLGLVLLPGLLAAGVGSLIFIGLDALTGLGKASLALPGLPPFDRPDVAQFGWALVIGVLAALVGSGIRWLAVLLRARVERRTVLLTAVAGLSVAGLAMVYTTATGHSLSDVLFSGEAALGPLLQGSAGYSVGALLVLLACKGLAYSVSLSSFRGGPVFPAMFVGAAGGIALSHLPGLPLVAGVAMGIGAMCAVMLKLPLTSVLLATLLLSSDGLAVMPLVIVAVVVAHVVSARLVPVPPVPVPPVPVPPVPVPPATRPEPVRPSRLSPADLVDDGQAPPPPGVDAAPAGAESPSGPGNGRAPHRVEAVTRSTRPVARFATWLLAWLAAWLIVRLTEAVAPAAAVEPRRSAGHA
jgi:H+/Cl- antiporter ClcA